MKAATSSGLWATAIFTGLMSALIPGTAEAHLITTGLGPRPPDRPRTARKLAVCYEALPCIAFKA